MAAKDKQSKDKVTGWLLDSITPLIGRLIELLFRIILFILPLGLYLTLIQYRTKVSKVSNISVYTTDESVWQHIFPGFILVAINPESFKKHLQDTKRTIQNSISNNKYLIEVLFMIAVLVLMYVKGIK